MEAPRSRSLFALQDLQAAIPSIRQNPDFQAAFRTAMADVVRLYEGNRLLNTVVNDRGRFVVGHMSLYQHFFGTADDPVPGLMVSRMKKLCVDQSICSPGRVETMLILMRLFGYLELAPATGDRRRRLLVPTEKMLAAQRARWEIQVRAMAPILPAGARALEALHHPDFLPAMICQLGDHFLAGLRIAELVPEAGLFFERNAGITIMFSLLLAGPAGAGIARDAPVAISITVLSRQFGVSRAHVRKLLQDAASQNYIARTDDDEGHILLLPPIRDAAEGFVAAGFFFLAHCAPAAMEEIARKRVA